MAAIAYPIWVVVDDAGAVVLGATVSVASVKTKAGADVAAHGATVSLSEANVCVDYDAEAKGEAWVTLAVSKAGSTFTGLNAAPRAYLVADAQKVAPLTYVAGTGEVKADPHRAGAQIAAAAAPPSAADNASAVWAATTRAVTGGTITTYTGNTPQTGDSFARIGANGAGLTAVAGSIPLDGGVVSASPAPTVSTFSATGAALNAATAGYSRASAPMRAYFTSGPNVGQERPLVATTGHVKAGVTHAFVVSAPFQFAPASGDTFILLPGDPP